MGQPSISSAPFDGPPSDTALTNWMVETVCGYVKVPGYTGLSDIVR
jgi:hypothetical protein